MISEFVNILQVCSVEFIDNENSFFIQIVFYEQCWAYRVKKINNVLLKTSNVIMGLV